MSSLIPELREWIARRAHALREQFRTHRAAWIGALVQLALVTLLFGPVVRVMYAQTDYKAHMSYAESWIATNSLVPPLPHFLFHLLAILVYALLPRLGLLGGGLIVGVLGWQALGVILYALVVQALAWIESPIRRVALTIALALSMMVIMPISLVTAFDQNLYLGYITPINYHNPTTTLLRPLCIPLFLLAVRTLEAPPPQGRWASVLGAAVLSVLSTLTKPNYALCLLPGLGLALVYRRYIQRQPVNWALFIIGLAVPLTSVLGWQYIAFYQFQTVGAGLSADRGIDFAPLAEMRAMSDDWLLLKFLLSVAFPVAVYSLHFRRARTDSALNLAWVVFAVAIAYAYLLANRVRGVYTGDFIWGSQIALHILMVLSALFVLRSVGDANRGRVITAHLGEGRFRFVAALYGLHVLNGVVWYALVFLSFIPGFPSWTEWM